MKQSYFGRLATQRLAPLADSCPSLRRLGAALLLVLGLATGSAQGQGQQQRGALDFFRADAAARTAAAASSLAATLARSQALTLDEPGLRAALATAPLESRAGAAPLVLALPQPDGTSARFALREAPIMEAPLAARYPMIRTYAGVGLDDATATVRLDLTPQGFHAQVLRGTGPGFLIDPVSPTDTRHCLSYYQKDVKPTAAGQAGSCGFKATPAEEQASAARVAAWRAAGGAAAARSTGAQLRVYRLALTCTPEYSLARGNTTASVLAALVVSLNRVVGIFERELTMRLVLVANNDQLIFLSGTGPQPSPALTDNNKFSLLNQSEPNINRIIGEANYDLGHLIKNVFDGGVANPGVLCNPGKGRGVSCDDIKTIAHEMGHQLGAQHTFNSLVPGANSVTTAWEPGGGITIMSYGGGINPASDVQLYSELLYHTGSYEAIQAVINDRSCGTSVATGNSAPVVSVPISGKTLPVNTPFQLTATATDAENDPLTYSWEQFDLGPIGDLNMPQVTGETPPLFRFWLPTTSPIRYFPRLAELVNNTAPLGERLPTVARGLKFRCTARDLHNGPAGLTGGISYSALVTLEVSAGAGPFVVSAPNAAGLSWASGSTQTVTWNVANTDKAPVSCAKVNLRLSLDGGLTYPLTLATGINNNGTASITVPNAPTATARIMVEAADNYFFDLSNADFAITPGPGPVISSFTPAFGPVGTVVTLTGTNFTGATAVRFNGTAASFTVVSATSLRATVAAGSSSGLITVTTPAGTGSSATPFRVGPPPTITSFTPTSGPTGTTVQVTGANLLGTTQVTLNGVPVLSFSINSATQLTLTVPDEATTGLLAVTTPFGTGTSPSPFTVLLRPVITSFTPTRGTVGTVVVISGQNFTGATQVRFGGIAASTFTVNSATQLRATVPIGALTGPLSVTTPAGMGVSGNFFTVVPTPALTAISPASGVVGMTVTLTGTALDLVTSLTLNGVAVPGFVIVNATTITFRVPAGATTGNVLGTASGGDGVSSVRFTVLTPTAGLVISGIVPAQGITGSSIRLTGTGFTGATQVTFTGSSANTVSAAAFTVNAAGTELTGLVVPNGALTGVLTITTPAGTSAASSQVFTVCALPTAVARNVQVVLGTAGTATLVPTAVNNSSTANCGVAAAATLSVAPNTFSTADLGPPVVAGSLRLNGSGQYVAIGGSTTVPTGNSPYTIEAWVKPAATDSYGIIGWGLYGGSSSCNALRLSPTGLVNYWWGNDLELPTPSLAGAWHHVAATYDGTTRTLYLDGAVIGSDRPTGHNVPDARNLRIGSTNNEEFFNGNIDEVRVWNVARTATELSTARGAHLLRNPAGLVAYYRFSEGSGTSTVDANGVAANAGTLTSGSAWSTDAPRIVNGVPVVLTVTDASGHIGTAPAVATVVPASATATTAANATAFSVWPNPVGAKGALHITLSVPAALASLSLRNSLGQLVRARTFAGSAAELPTAGLASGLYLLSVQADGHAPTVRRVVVE